MYQVNDKNYIKNRRKSTLKKAIFLQKPRKLFQFWADFQNFFTAVLVTLKYIKPGMGLAIGQKTVKK